jgi:hypothetical protein
VKELWAELEDFPDYTVSSLGEIANMKSGMPRKTSINQQGIVKISLYRGRELITRSVAVLVATAFVEGQDPLFNTPIHLDGDRENCRADNLMWRPRWFAVQYHRQFLDRAFHEAAVHFEDVATGREYHSVKEACMAHGLYHVDVYNSFAHETHVPITFQEFRLIPTE